MKAAAKKKTTTPKKDGRWSAKVTKTSDALDLKSNVFKAESANKVAKSLKNSAEKSHRIKGTPFQSAMSMLNFYINRAGKNLSERKKKTLEAVKTKLRHLFHRPVTKRL